MPKVLLKNGCSEIIWDQDRIDLNTDVSFIEIRKYRLSNKTLNTHEIVTGKKNPKLVRGRSGVGPALVRRKWSAFIDMIKVLRIRIIQINLN